MRSGLEILLSERRELIEGKATGLIVNQTSVDHDLTHSIDLFAADPDLRPARIFGPEHGARGDAQDMDAVSSHKDSYTGIPVVSLYGATEATLRPAEADLEGLDVLVFDIQDIGARYYTFIYTMAFCMEAAGRANIPIVVCDRPNPINGRYLEGSVIDPVYRSFVGGRPLPVRHGMTVGELARYFRYGLGIECDLEVVAMKGWRRDQWFDQTGLPWVQPSPNMPSPDTAIVYPGLCLVEGTNVSEGRGTTRPFHLVGAPWMDARRLATALNAEQLPGVRFRPTWFTPMFQKHRGQLCGGVELHVIDREVFKPLLSGVAVLERLQQLFPGEFRWRTEPYEFVSDRLAIDLLAGGESLRRQIESNTPLAEIEESWSSSLEAFRAVRADYLIYG